MVQELENAASGIDNKFGTNTHVWCIPTFLGGKLKLVKGELNVH